MEHRVSPVLQTNLANWKLICIIYAYVYQYVSVYDRPDRPRLGDIGGDFVMA